MSTPREQLEEFIGAMFEPSDFVELRPIETWEDDGKKRSRLLFRDRAWIRASALPDHFDRLNGLNVGRERGNIFFGVAPRPRPRTGKKDDIKVVRCIWVDVDDCSPDEFSTIVSEAGLPKPSIIIDSGHGTHAYWLLDEPFAITCTEDRDRIESIMTRLSDIIGGDSTHDLSRILRLPGFDNVKNMRNATKPVPCRVVALNGYKLSLSCIESHIGPCLPVAPMLTPRVKRGRPAVAVKVHLPKTAGTTCTVCF